MLDASVRDNLTLGENFDDAALQTALDRASLSAWLSRLPQGLESRIGHRGARLSGGERHRLALARIFLRKPRVLLFDETTASLDAHLAAKIWSTVEHLFPAQTLIIASHQRPDLHGLTHHLHLSDGVWTTERM